MCIIIIIIKGRNAPWLEKMTGRKVKQKLKDAD